MEDKKERQLAAIMFTDIVGYTALMHADEALAESVRARHREVFRQQHQKYHGKIVQYYGDGTLSIFRSAIEAAQCAIAIQRLLHEGKPVPLRIGLHMGDIVLSKAEVYGDGVNIASRIQNLGIAGTILLSGKLNDELKNHQDISTISRGFFELKNIAQPVEVFAITNEGIVVPQTLDHPRERNESYKTIAVLPFINMSTSAENEYFSDGITEEIINALSGIKSLRVTSRTSSFYFKNKDIPIKQIGKELNVSAILEGSVRISGNMIRITAQLIQAAEDFHFWSQSWDRKLENIFEIQDEISLLIAEKLREQFGHFEIEEHLVKKQTDNIPAYEYSLKAKFYANKWNPSDSRLAISLYENALELDPAHTESYLGLAQCYGFLATTGFMPAEEAWEKSRQATNKALLLNDSLAGVHHQLAHLSFFTACNYKEAVSQLKKAIEIKPNYAEAHQFISFLYILAGNRAKAFHHLDTSLKLDPLSQETQFYSAYFHYMTADYTRSLSELDKCLHVNPKNLPAHTVKCYCLLKMSRCDEVIHYFDQMPPEIVVPGNKLGLTALAYAVKKDVANTKKYLDQMLEFAKGPAGFQIHSYLFMMYAVIGDNDKAFSWISHAIESKSSFILFNFADPLADSLKDDPRYLQVHKVLYLTDHTIEKKKKDKVILNEVTAATLSNQLLNHMHKAKPYMDPDLSLRSLALQINLHPNQLSWLLNERLGKSFNEFINQYRIETFISLTGENADSAPDLSQLVIDSGFKKKSAFNNYFKKYTGLTLKQFLKRRGQALKK